jgi:starvation-inducible DNA-binding protein
MKTLVKENQTYSEKLVNGLNSLLSDYQIYYQNLRGLHWLVSGMQFLTLHEKYEALYNEAALTIDELAERILMLGGTPLHTYEDYLMESKLKSSKDVSGATEGIQVILENSKYLLKKFRENLEIASDAGDEGTVDLLTGLIRETEKRIWMFSAMLNK